MSKGRYTLLAFLIAVWVVVFILLETIIGGFLGIPENMLEFWPAMVGPSLITLMIKAGGGDSKTTERNYYFQGAVGILGACLYILMMQKTVPALGHTPGIALALCVALTIVIASGFFVPALNGAVGFVYFTFGTMGVVNILPQTLIRLVVLLVGTKIFLIVEHFIINMVKPKPQKQ